jgi:hypothetical protein
VASIANISKIPELRRRILFTLFILAIYRLGVFITIPGVNRVEMEHVVSKGGFDAYEAFVSKQGHQVIVQAVKTGKVVNRIAVGPARDETFPTLAGDDKRFVVVFGGERAGEIAVIDRATENVTAHAAKRCP